MQQPTGFFLVDKPNGPTSNRILQDIKRRVLHEIGQKDLKFGHAGTLDSFASGLLIVLVGKLTRLMPWFMGQMKEYVGIFRFGMETDTLDPEGTIIAEAPLPHLDMLEKSLNQFRGTISQIPPEYSAVHVSGKRAYSIAMQGKKPALRARNVNIERLELMHYEQGRASVSIRCSSGTYIRALARDIALACGSRAYLESLRRISIGPFSIAEACAPDRCSISFLSMFDSEIANSLGLNPGTLSQDFIERFMHGSSVPKSALHMVKENSFLSTSRKDGLSIALFSEQGSFIGLATSDNQGLNPTLVAIEDSVL
jgi:tRNA pseudouridine55 synthase